MKRIDVLPDDVLLEIFAFYYADGGSPYFRKEVEAWHTLVHVCQHWRSLVLRSPRRLHLQIYCTPETPSKDKLDIWPALHFVVAAASGYNIVPSGMDNLIAALGQSNRVCDVNLSDLGYGQLEDILAAMQVPFPELTGLTLQLLPYYETPPSAIPNSFLGGSAPRLQFFQLSGIPFPGFPKLLLSADHLVYLCLYDIPHSAYVSPEIFIALLSALSSLFAFSLGFQSPQSHPGWESRSLPPQKRSILPALNTFRFKGAFEYLEELVACIDTPHLGDMHITLFNQIDFDCPRLAQFINCTPTFRAHDEAHVRFNKITANVELINKYRISCTTLLIKVLCRESDWQLSFIEQVCNTSLPLISTVEVLYIKRQPGFSFWKVDSIENTLWLELLLLFTAVKSLYLSKEFAPKIAAALKELAGARIIEILPCLKNIFVHGL